MRSRRARLTVAIATASIVAGSLVGVGGAPAGAGGDVTINWAVEAETSGGYCLPNARLAAPGIQVANAVYDSLMAFNADGEYVPYLAESFEPNATFDEWTITLRDGVKFHDGTPLDADALKLNLDTYRGAPDSGSPVTPQLFLFVFGDIDTVTVADPLTVVVKTKRPWVGFPAYWASGRTGIVAPAQLADADTCPTNLIGTGPFKFVEFRQNESLTVEKNPDYWRKGFPKADRIVFKPVTDQNSRVAGLVGGQFDLTMSGGSTTLGLQDLEERAKNGELKVLTSESGAEVSYVLLNSSKAPFDDKVARQAVSFCGDARQTNEIRNKGRNTIATGPFPPDNPSYLDAPPRKRDIPKAKKLVAEYEETHGQPLAFEYTTNPDPELLAIAQLLKEQCSEAGVEVSIRTVDQAALINEALAGTYEAAGFRNHPGGDPDTNYVWWKSDSPVNFGRIKDTEIDRLLDEGREESDPAEREQIYLDLNKRFASELYNLWSWYTLWGVGYQNDVSGVKGPALPDGGGKPAPLFTGVVPTLSVTKK